MKILPVIVLLIVGGSLPAVAQNGPKIKIGGKDLPADCALAKNERPRLLFRGRDLSLYKARIEGPLKEDFERLKAYWDRRIAEPDYAWQSSETLDGVALGVLYQLTGKKRYADAILRSTLFKKGQVFWAQWFVLDLIIDALSPEELKTLAEFALRVGPQNNAAFAVPMAVALYGAGTGRDEELAKLMETGIDHIRKDMFYHNLWAQDRGGSGDSFSYNGNHVCIRMPANLTALYNALGQDLWQECAWLRHLGSYYVYHYLPWRAGTIHFDHTDDVHIGPNSADFGGTTLLRSAPTHYQDGLYQWWVNVMYPRGESLPEPKDYPTRAHLYRIMCTLWARILFHDPNIPALKPENFPPSRFFNLRGLASMRENWRKDATLVHFRCGVIGNLADSRHNVDNNTFTLYKKGILALDTGVQHMTEAAGLKFKPADDQPNHQYSSQTFAHNAILVRHEADDAFWKSQGRPNAGGQVFRTWPEEWDKIRGYPVEKQAGGQASWARTGKILAWETSPAYDYVCGDATASYSPVSLKSFTRQLAYVRPNLVFIYDRVETAREDCHTSWLLHTADKPKTDGKETPDTRIHPEGHFLWQEGDVTTITDEEMGGRAFCKTLLPAKREVRLLGGENHEFELIDGRNMGPTPETYKFPMDSWEVKRARANGIGLRGWRIELEDRSGGTSPRFLHVFQTCDQGTARMAPCRRVEQGEYVGAEVEEGGRKVRVLFQKTGPVGGRVLIEAAGKAQVDRALVTEIQDNYLRWKEHPDFPKWMTDPHRRSVILGAPAK